MKDNTFIIILILFLFVVYLGNKAILKRSNEVTNQNSINILQNNLDSLKQANIELRNYAMSLEDICDKYKSSRDAKYNYHLRTKTIIE